MIKLFTVFFLCIAISASDLNHKERNAIFRVMKNLHALTKKIPYFLKSIKELQSDFGDSVTCIICDNAFDVVEKLEKLNSLKCGHIFCRKCIKPWKDKGKSCPHCRDVIIVVNDPVVDKKWKTKDTIYLLSSTIESLESIKQTENRKNMVKLLRKHLIAEMKSTEQTNEIKEKIKGHQVQIKQSEEKQDAKSNRFKSKYKEAKESEINYELINDERKKLPVKSETQASNESTKTMKILKAAIAFLFIWNMLRLLVGEAFYVLFWPYPESFLPSARGQFNGLLFYLSIHNFFDGVSASKCHLFILILVLFLMVQTYTI